MGHFPSESDQRYWRAGCQETGTSGSGEGGRKSTITRWQLVGFLSHVTAIWTQEGWLSLAGVLDLFSRSLVGWAMAPIQDEALVQNALRMALLRRHPQPGLLHHSDRGEKSYQLRLPCCAGSGWNGRQDESYRQLL